MDYNTILAVCAAIVTVSAAVTALAGWVSRAKAPNERQNERISTLETRMDKAEARLANGDGRFRSQDEDIRVMMEALLALMKHAVNGNDVDALKTAQKNLEHHLVEGGRDK